MALMGPSGSGKTTLLNVLAGRQATAKCKTEGDILVDRAAILRKTFQKLSSFVEQEHSLIGSLTVAETLDFAARLALPRFVQQRVPLWCPSVADILSVQSPAEIARTES